MRERYFPFLFREKGVNPELSSSFPCKEGVNPEFTNFFLNTVYTVLLLLFTDSDQVSHSEKIVRVIWNIWEDSEQFYMTH